MRPKESMMKSNRFHVFKDGEVRWFVIDSLVTLHGFSSVLCCWLTKMSRNQRFRRTTVILRWSSRLDSIPFSSEITSIDRTKDLLQRVPTWWNPNRKCNQSWTRKSKIQSFKGSFKEKDILECHWWTYHGAKNLMNTVFPSVTESQVSGVREGTDADAVAAAMARMVAENFIVISYI